MEVHLNMSDPKGYAVHVIGETLLANFLTVTLFQITTEFQSISKMLKINSTYMYIVYDKFINFISCVKIIQISKLNMHVYKKLNRY